MGAGVGGTLGGGLELGGGLGGEDGLGDEDKLGSGFGDGVIDGVEDAPGVRLGRAVGDKLADDDGLGDDDTSPCAVQWSRTELAGHAGTLADTPLTFPDARQP
jgi:hypothetical protein